MTRDRLIGILTAVLGAAVAIMTTQLAPSNMAGDIGPKVFPAISAGILIVCGVILILRKPGPAPKPFLEGAERLRFLAIIGVIIAYIVLLWAVGFVVPTFLMLFVLCMMFGREEKVPLWQAALYAVIVTAVIYVMFSMVLHLRLPTGKLIQLF